MEEKGAWVLVILLKCTSKSVSETSISKGKFDLGFQASVKKILILLMSLKVRFVSVPLVILTAKFWMEALHDGNPGSYLP